jgi:hypothetical protein
MRQNESEFLWRVAAAETPLNERGGVWGWLFAMGISPAALGTNADDGGSAGAA